ncbi:MAG: glycosyltransferase family 1 protein [Tannerella sp.]|jgi:hypothetical protein|nr:glycosyltransferase family 1 protein [Tannerella sp.]
MDNLILNLVAINIPWPANYGGVIDIYCKIKALHDAGVGIILHCFEYERPHAKELEEVCMEVHYYRRRTGLAANFSLLPYNVYSRKNKRLLDNLASNGYPILFEGLHTCYYMNESRLAGRFKIFRECNIEHEYYLEIARAERNTVKKCFFYIEAWRFRRFQKRVAAADLMIAVSQTDADYLSKEFPQNRVEFIPCFHGNDGVRASEGQSDFLLYHGKLSVQENEKAALYLIENVFGSLPEYGCIIAGMNPSKALLRAASAYRNIRVEANPSLDRINELVRTAQINLLVTFQATGLKLKLLNSLFNGRHVAVNTAMLAGSGLDSLCHIADSAAGLTALCRELMRKPFTSDILEERLHLLFPTYSDEYQAARLINMIRCGRKG